jgi:hypothetical protein
METMKGETWLRSVAAENLHFDTAIDAISTEQQRKEIAASFHAAAEEAELEYVYQSGSIKITPGGLYSLTWKWNDTGKDHEAAAVQSIDNYVWAVEADKEGREVYTVSCYSKKGLVWRNKTSVAPYICVKDGRCYLLEATAELRYGQCVSLDAKTGKGRRLLFTEESLENNLSLIPGENECIFLQSDNSGKKVLYVVEGDEVIHVGDGCISFVPVGYGPDKEPCFFGRIGSFSAPWTAFGDDLNYNIPITMRSINHKIELFSLKHGILVTSAGGERNIYRCFKDSLPQKIDTVVGVVAYDTYSVWSNQKDTLRLICTVPGETPSIYDIGNTVKVTKGQQYAKYTVERAKSKDGSYVPYVLVQKDDIKGLMVVIYGAYGIPTGLGTSRWKPYLDAGWGIVFGLIRGGGDFGDEWADAARTYKKWKSVDDTIAVIHASQKLTGINWKRTCIYGRSAGGYTLGAVVAYHGRRGLIGAAYAEVPFVDVLRTTSTPSLPLTILEYNEFGNPVDNPRDRKTIRELSPVDALPAEGAPGVFVVARTSLNDREVLPNETVKWIRRLRGRSGEEKYLSLTGGHGHFVRGATGDRQKGDDFLLLNAWLESQLRVGS